MDNNFMTTQTNNNDTDTIKHKNIPKQIICQKFLTTGCIIIAILEVLFSYRRLTTVHNANHHNIYFSANHNIHGRFIIIWFCKQADNSIIHIFNMCDPLCTWHASQTA